MESNKISISFQFFRGYKFYHIFSKNNKIEKHILRV